jgi:hypothetical protein
VLVVEQAAVTTSPPRWRTASRRCREIDPQIVALGRRFHPEHPYDDPRVTIHVDDARSFLDKTGRQYDLIIFALPDSLVLASNLSGVRLESFLFTRESFQSVQGHLKPDGLFVAYNYFRYDWLVGKLGAMVERVFGERPIYHSYADPDSQRLVFATLFAGPRARQVDLNQPGFGFPADSAAPPATDNWPFLYMRGPGLPAHYTAILGLILAFSFLYLRRLARQPVRGRTGYLLHGRGLHAAGGQEHRPVPAALRVNLAGELPGLLRHPVGGAARQRAGRPLPLHRPPAALLAAGGSSDGQLPASTRPAAV